MIEQNEKYATHVRREIKIRERRNGALETIGTALAEILTVDSFDKFNPLHAQWLQAAIDAAQTAQVLAAVVRKPDGSIDASACPVTLEQLVQPTESRTGEYPRQKKAWLDLAQAVLAASDMPQEKQAHLLKYAGNLEAIPLLGEKAKSALERLARAIYHTAEANDIACGMYAAKIDAALIAQPEKEDFGW